MKFLVLSMLIVLFATVSAEEAEPEIGDEIAIAVQNQSIYPRPAFYAAPVEPVVYGTVAVIDAVSGEWFKITTADNKEGWIHCTAVSGAIQVTYGGTTASGEVTSDEIMLAGRGFSQAIEETYSEEHPELNFSLVDNMETMYPVSPEQLFRFLIDGNLLEEEGSR